MRTCYLVPWGAKNVHSPQKVEQQNQRRIALNVAKQQSLSLRSEDVNEPNNKRARTSSEFERLLDQDNSTIRTR